MGTFAKQPARKARDRLVGKYKQLRVGLGGRAARSDHYAFCKAGIPCVFFWTPDAKCYHEACDTFANNNDHALNVNSDAIGFAMLTFAYSTETVNGVPGKRVPGQGKSDLPTPAGPQGTFDP